MRSIIYSYLIGVLIFSSCSSGKQAYIQGNYYEAVITSVSRLRRDSDHQKSTETLRQAYPLATSYFEDRVTTSLGSTIGFKWVSVVESYTTLNSMYDEIRRCPGALKVIPNPVNYYSKLQEAKQNAAEEYYAAGLASMAFGTREKAKIAYGHFKTSKDYVTDYKDATKKMEEALWAAMVKVVIEPAPVSKKFGVSADFFDRKVSEYLHTANIDPYVRFFSPEEAKKLKLTADHIVRIEFEEFNLGQVSLQDNQVQLQRDSIERVDYVASVTPVNGNPLPNNITTGGISDKEKADREKVERERVDKENADREKTAKEKADKDKADKEKADKEKADKDKADKEKADKDKADKEKADKDKADKEKADKDKADKEKADKDKADKEKADKDKADKEKADKDKADKEKADKDQADKEKAEKEKADKEKADKDKADKEKADKDKADKEKADKDKADKDKADKEKADKDQADKEKAEKEKADKDKADKEKADKDKADKEKADKDKADKEKADKDKADKEKADKDKADKEKADKDKADKEKADKDQADKEKAEKEKADKDKADKEKADKEKAEKEKADKDKADKEKADKEKADKEKAEKEKAEKEKADKDKADKEKADKDKADKEKADKDKADKENEEKKKSEDKKTDEKKDNKNEGTSFLILKEPTYVASSVKRGLRMYPNTSLALDTSKVYNPVKATLHNYKKTRISKGSVIVRIIDAKSNAVLSEEKIPGEYVWVSEWATFKGDERALSPEQHKLCKQNEKLPPAAQDTFVEFTKPIFDTITSKFQSFYKNY